MKVKLFFKPKPRVGWRGPSGAANPVVIGTIVALIIAGAYAAIIIFVHKG